MKKIPSLYVYDPATLHRGRDQQIKGGARYSDQVTPGCEWAANGEGRATEKVDGSACLVRVGRLFKRYDAKHGKTPPPGFEAAQPEPDPMTGHWPGWLAVGTGLEDKWHRSVLAPNALLCGHGSCRLCSPACSCACHSEVGMWSFTREAPTTADGTYELVGEKLQSNPYGIEGHRLVPHGANFVLPDEMRNIDGVISGAGGEPIARARWDIESFLKAYAIEGLVFHHPDGRMAKVTRRGFGLTWPVEGA